MRSGYHSFHFLIFFYAYFSRVEMELFIAASQDNNAGHSFELLNHLNL